MNREEFYRKMDEVFDLEPGTIDGEEKMFQDGLLDSISMLGLITFLDRDFKVTLSSEEINDIGTVNNLFERVSRF